MVNWYYVMGSERVGPVGVDALKQLFLNDEINLETYVWKKGFQNWERLKDVGELKFETEADDAVEETQQIEEPVVSKPAPVQVKASAPAPAPVKAEGRRESECPNSPEIQFVFDWNKVRENEELFFVRIGKDRRNFTGSDIFGPYSLVELREALTEKRVNFQTSVFAPGMSSWTKIQETPLNENYKGSHGLNLSLTEVPLIMVFDYSPLPLITVVKKAGTKDGVLLGAGPFTEFENKTVRATLYVGNEIKVKNVQVKIQGYDKKEQSIECQFLDLNQDAKRIMLNHAV